MGGLTARVPHLRQVWARQLDTTATLTHTPLVSDGAGSVTPGTPTTTTVACRVQPDTTTPAEILAAGGLAGFTYWQIKLPAGTVIDATDTLTVDGLVYQVQGVDTGRSNEFGLSVRAVRGAS